MKNIMENWKNFITEDKAIDRGVKPMTIKLSFTDADPMKGQVFKVLYYNRKFDRFTKDLGKKIDNYLNANKDKKIFVGPLIYKPRQIHPQTAKHIQAMIQDKLGQQLLSGQNLQRLILQKAPKILNKPNATLADYIAHADDDDGKLAQDFGIIVLRAEYM